MSLFSFPPLLESAMFTRTEINLFDAIALSHDRPGQPVSVVVRSIRTAVESLASYGYASTVSWIGNEQRATCSGIDWKIELIAGDSEKLLTRLRDRAKPSVFLPVLKPAG